jgi:putative ABC transport system ATP-binding protein
LKLFAGKNMIKAISVVKHYAGAEKPAVDHLDLEIQAGEFLSIVGRSGSGKTTLLHILSSLVKPDSGRVLFQGQDICVVSEKRKNDLRGRKFAMVFQQHHLLPYLSALENVLLPFLGTWTPLGKQHAVMARDMLKRVGLEHKENSLPGKLSGGEQQRVAIARALVRGATVLFADEPTGSLDFATGLSIMKLLHEFHDDGVTIVMVTHNDEFAAQASRTVKMADGKIL